MSKKNSKIGSKLSAFLSGVSMPSANANSNGNDGDEDEDEDEEDGDEDGAGNKSQKIDVKALEDAASADIAAANKRWNDVIASDAGMANPAGAAHLLMNSDMSAANVIAALDTVSAGQPGGGEGEETQNSHSQSAGNKKKVLKQGVDPKTGSSSSSEDEEGEDRTAVHATVKSRREKRNAKERAKAVRSGLVDAEA